MLDEHLLHIVLFEPEIPQNTGNIGRTCVAVDAKLWLVRPLGFRLDERRLRRAGMDYWQHLDWEIVADWDTLQQRLPDRPMWLMTKTGQRCYTAAEFSRGDVLVFGSESRGLPPSLLQADPQRCLRIPMREEARSLNLACSVAVAAYEALRQIQVGTG
ncbi:MAG: tRNA (cytidine(34)-2'-O)-methyltransferase [Pirellulaceae bacterium]|nr:tRNA (cytidine(34)-2'-O)-methyltransferase [Pirellulaceae bacterium]